MKKKYEATFADGTVIKRASDRDYGYAWRVVYSYDYRGKRIEDSRTGFSRDYVNAQKQVQGFGWIMKQESGDMISEIVPARARGPKLLENLFPRAP